ncbi:MAG: hypothetical protein ACK4NC_07100 [Candidatus Gracilibacteria bacterium]
MPLSEQPVEDNNVLHSLEMPVQLPLAKEKEISTETGLSEQPTLSEAVQKQVHEQVIAALNDIKDTEKSPERKKVKYHVEVKPFSEISDEEVEVIVQEYIESFATYPWGEYYKCSHPECNYKVSAEKYFKFDKGADVNIKSLEKLELPETKAQKLQELACTDHTTTELAKFWEHDYVKDDFQSKFTENGHISLLKTEEGELVGYAGGYAAPFGKIYDHEFKKFYEKEERLMEEYKQKVGEHLDITFNDETLAYNWSILVILNGHRGLENFFNICKKFLDQMPSEYKQLPIVGEANKKTTLYAQLRAAGGIDICDGIVPNIKLMLFAKKLQDYIDYFPPTVEQFIERNQAEYKKGRQETDA